jgi:Icc-related predicted phosphoesterase
VRVAALADLHCGVDGAAEMSRILDGVQDAADVLLLGGDLTNLGLPEEGDALLEALAPIPLPVVAVLGNHDHESGRAEELAAALLAGGVKLLDGTALEIDGVGFAGVKGFAGGFVPHRLSAFGEQAIKTFVDVAVREAAALDRALASLETPHRVALLH